MSKKELAKQETGTEIAEVGMDAFGSGGLSSSDVIIPKIMTMQGLSKLVMDGEAKFGDFVDSMTNEVLGGPKEPLEFIPFAMKKIWVISKKNGNDFEYDRIEDVTPANEGRPWTEIVDGQEYKNDKVMNFYVLLTKDMSMPYVLPFKGTSMKAGRALATQMYMKNKAAGKHPAAKAMTLESVKNSNDKGTYAVLNTKVSRDSNADEVKECLRWYQAVAGGEVKEHDDSVSTEQTTSSQF